MRIGRWLYHHAPHIEQSPIFQVKKAAVRVTAWLPDGLTPAIQILVGDNPSDPAAYWVNMRMNGQEVRLGNDYATQVVIANSGWYRVDPTDLALLGPALIWAEDEEGTMDDKVIPVHVVRAGCGGTSAPTPEPPAITITCADLNNLVASASLVTGAWYRVIDTTPATLDGEPYTVFLRAMSSSEVSRSGYLSCPTLDAGRLWPCHVSGNFCSLTFVHDLNRNNVLYGYGTISSWPFTSPACVRNFVVNSSFTFASGAIKATAVISNNHISGSFVYMFSSALLIQNNIFQSTLRFHGSDGATIYNNRIHSQSTIYVEGNPHIEGCKIGGSYISITPYLLAPPQAVYNVFLNACYIEASSISIQGSVLGQGLSVYGAFVRRSYLQVLGGMAYSGTFVQVHDVTIENNSNVSLSWAGFCRNIRVNNASSFVVTYQVNTVNQVYGGWFENISLENRSRFEYSAPYAIYYPTFTSLSVTNGSTITTSGFWSATISDVTVTDQSTISIVSPYIRINLRLASSHFRRANVSMTSVAAGGNFLVSDTTVDNSFLEVSDGSINAYGLTEVGQSRVSVFPNMRLVIRGTIVNASRISAANNFEVYSCSITGSRVLHYQNPLTKGFWAVREMTVEGSDVFLAHQAQNINQIRECTFTASCLLNMNALAGSTGGVIFSKAVLASSQITLEFGGTGGPYTVEGLYSFGLQNIVRTFTTGYTGAVLRNF